MDFARRHMFKEKRTRTDVAVRKQRARDTSCTIVKTTWNSFCKPEAKSLALESCLYQVHKAITEAYLLANMHVMRMCELNKPMPEICQTFYYQCLSAVSWSERNRATIKDLLFRQTVDEYMSCRPDSYVPAYSSHLGSGWFQQASQQMSIAAKNSTSMNFWRRFKRYLKSKYDLGKDAWMVVRDIRTVEYGGDNQLVRLYRSLVPSKPKYGNVEDYPELVMPLQHMFLQHFECEQQIAIEGGVQVKKQHRLFSLLPTKQGFECSHLKVCTNGLYGLLKRSGVEGLPADGAAFRAVGELYWRRLFNIEKFETCNRVWGGEVLTDGKAVSIVLRKPKSPEPSKTQPNPEDFQEVWGVDPGRREVFVASNRAHEVERCSTKQYYHMAGFKRSCKKVQMWEDQNEAVKKALDRLQKVTKKTSSSAVLGEYVHELLQHLDTLLTFHVKKGYRDLKFGRYIGRQKALQKLCNQITVKAGRNTLVGFGDWSNKDSAGIIKKCPAGPVKQFERELKKRCMVVSVDEFRSSKLHECCHASLKPAYIHQESKKDHVVRKVKAHSVLFCDNRSCCGMRVNRDVNASRNMLALLLAELTGGAGRPAAFRRGEVNERYPALPTAVEASIGAGLGQDRCRVGTVM